MDMVGTVAADDGAAGAWGRKGLLPEVGSVRPYVSAGGRTRGASSCQSRPGHVIPWRLLDARPRSRSTNNELAARMLLVLWRRKADTPSVGRVGWPALC